MRSRMTLLGLFIACTAILSVTVAQAQTSNCKTVEGPGYFAQACGSDTQVSGGPGGATARSGPAQGSSSQSTPSPSASATPVADGFTPVPSPTAEATPTPTMSPLSPLDETAPLGLIGVLLRLLGL